MFRSALLIFLAVFGPNFAHALATRGKNKIPSYIKICSRSDPYLNECVKSSVEAIKPYLGEGIPELMIPKCNPLKLEDDINVELFTEPNFIRVTYSDVQIMGATDFKLTSVDLDLMTNVFKVGIDLPKLETIGNLDIKGKVSSLPIAGQGPSHGNYTDVHADAILVCENIIQNNEIYLNVKDISVKISMGYVHLNLQKVFAGEFGKFMDEFLGKNSETIAEEIIPLLEKSIGAMFQKLSNRIFNKFPLDELLPPKNVF
ncbi:protein takeout-like [Cimex lectularius]|uniref:Uncharacterized protein n=1 Tax=Cimex lectularius TaxID=79782 RepID=A0A8I6RHC1_CIMLE|nr:protein takeout-like [Cimex lectularius]